MVAHAFAADEAKAVYRAIHERRDMRHFAGGEVAPEVLRRLLDAAHHAPSVGFMQPWRFIRVRGERLRRQLHGWSERERVPLPPRSASAKTSSCASRCRACWRQLLVVTLADVREHMCSAVHLAADDRLGLSAPDLWLAARSVAGHGLVLFDPPS